MQEEWLAGSRICVLPRSSRRNFHFTANDLVRAFAEFRAAVEELCPSWRRNY